MKQVIVQGSPHLIELFCSWFSNQGEQDLYEAHAGGIYDPKTRQSIYPTSYFGVEGYGIDEPITLVEYDKVTDEKVE